MIEEQLEEEEVRIGKGRVKKREGCKGESGVCSRTRNTVRKSK